VTKPPRILSIAQTYRDGALYATLSIQVPIEDLENVVHACDADDVQGASLEHAMDACMAMRKVRQAELAAAPAPAQQPAEPAPVPVDEHEHDQGEHGHEPHGDEHHDA
jgi:hypothetical protein